MHLRFQYGSIQKGLVQIKLMARHMEHKGLIYKSGRLPDKLANREMRPISINLLERKSTVDGQVWIHI